MKNTFLLFAGLLVSGFAYSQNHAAGCGSAEYLNELDAHYPGLKDRVEHVTDHGNYHSRGGTVTIPIVFHVVYNTATQNLPDNYLTAQLDLLNKSFARQNSDTTNMRSIFQSRVGPCKIRFMIDQIIRFQTTNTSFDATTGSGFANSDIVKQTGSGGDDAISPDKKLNVWICNLTKDGSDGLIGYAYPPAGAPNWTAGSQAPTTAFDGVVIDYIDVGGPAKQPKGYGSGFRGKAMVHEIGHYLGLRHIWGDDGGACQGDAGYKDDGISDTPVTDDNSNFDCNITKNTCIESSGDLLDMVENYMDYSSESCQNSFTKMQVSAMEYVLDNLRNTIRVPTTINEQEELAKKVTIYPNPTSYILYVDLNRMDYTSVKIEVISMIGQTLYHVQTAKTSSPIEINTSGFSKGIYFVNLQADDKQLITKKIIVQ